VPQNRLDDEDGVGHASGSSSLLHVEAYRARVFQSSLKTGGGAAWMVHLASSLRLHQVQAEDGRVDMMDYIRPFYTQLRHDWRRSSVGEPSSSLCLISPVSVAWSTRFSAQGFSLVINSLPPHLPSVPNFLVCARSR
jgi:hypothetical protein